MEEVEICIPAYNEEAVIIPTINTLLQLCDVSSLYLWKITVVDNASTDQTASFVLKHNDPRVFLLQYPVAGKGGALSFAASRCTSDFFLYIDADLSADPIHILDLCAEIKKGADIAVGSRLVGNTTINRSMWRTATAQFFRIYAQFLVPVPVVDSQCGLKMMNKKGIEILATCEEKGWFFDREFLAKAVNRNLTIAEVPITWEEFRYPDRKSKLHVVKAGLQSLYSLWIVRNNVRKFR